MSQERGWSQWLRRAGYATVLAGTVLGSTGCSAFWGSNESRWVGRGAGAADDKDHAYSEVDTVHIESEKDADDGKSDETYGVTGPRRDTAMNRTDADMDTYGVIMGHDSTGSRAKETGRMPGDESGVTGEPGEGNNQAPQDSTRDDSGVDTEGEIARERSKRSEGDNDDTKRMEKPSVRTKDEDRDGPMVGHSEDRYVEDSYRIDPDVSDGITGEVVLKYEKESDSLVAVVGDFSNNSRGDPVTRYGGSEKSPAYSYEDILGADVDSLAGVLAEGPAEREDIADHLEDHAESLGRLHIYREAIEQNRETMGDEVYNVARSVVMNDTEHAMDRFESLIDGVSISYHGPDVENEGDSSPYTITIAAQDRKIQW